ncbi:hypothetical protein F4808DRAFT_435726 [Astrocystis sublimbata]|nr:hypothetical protein F4808DRAFT_435726 [Astrocystis sublimbata]
MALRWLLDQFSPMQEEIPSTEPDQINRTFHCFAELPTELRLQIWGYYFDAPRIHVLYHGGSKIPKGLAGTPVAYADLTAGTNECVPASRRFAAAAINYEALELFQKTFDFTHINFMGLPSKLVKDLYEEQFRNLDDASPDRLPPITNEIMRSRPDLAEFLKNPDGRPKDMIVPGIHINWGNDLLYLTDGADVNCEVLRRLCNGPIAGKLRRVAVLIHDSCNYEGWRPFYGPSVDFPKPSTTPTEVALVVRLSNPSPVSNAIVARDEFGFAPYDSVVQGQKNDSWEWMQNMKLIERRFVYAAQVLREAFPDLEDSQIKVRTIFHLRPSVPIFTIDEIIMCCTRVSPNRGSFPLEAVV